MKAIDITSETVTLICPYEGHLKINLHTSHTALIKEPLKCKEHGLVLVEEPK